MKNIRKIFVCIISFALMLLCVSDRAIALSDIQETPVLISEESIRDGWVTYYFPDETIVTPKLLTEDEKNQVLDSLFEADITAVTQVIRQGLVTCEEVTKYYLNRIERYNPTYNCFITLMEEQALEQARRLDERRAAGDTEGVLFGVPIVVKDNIDVEGVYTTNGMAFSESRIASGNADVVNKMIAQGAVILGKTNMSIQAQNARYSSSKTIGMTYNAYSTALTSGGSSGGSAVAVSTNMCVAGLGTDTNSSLRIPAAMNGCVALRFTSGVLDRDGIIILNKTRDVPGAITRTVRDSAIMADILTGFSHDYEKNLDANALNGTRIGVLKELVNRYYSDDENKQNFKEVLAELEACGAILVDVSLPNLFSYSTDTENGVTGSTQRYLNAYNDMLKKYDVEAVVYPSYLSTPFSSARENGALVANSQNWVNNARPLASAIGIPEIAVPTGNHSNGGGLGMEISSSKNNEQLVLNLAYAYTEKYNHRTVPAGTFSDGEKNSVFSAEVLTAQILEREREQKQKEGEAILNSAVKTAVIGAKQIAFEQASYAKEALAIEDLREAAEEVAGSGRALKVFLIILFMVAAAFFALRLYAGYVEKQRRKRRRHRTK